jgi:hypothetical protein
MSKQTSRDAARLLRKTAETTSGHPWKVRLSYSKKHPHMVVAASWITSNDQSGISLKYPGLLAEKQWSALTNPALAEPLAKLLEARAGDPLAQAVADVLLANAPEAAHE